MLTVQSVDLDNRHHCHHHHHHHRHHHHQNPQQQQQQHQLRYNNHLIHSDPNHTIHRSHNHRPQQHCPPQYSIEQNDQLNDNKSPLTKLTAFTFSTTSFMNDPLNNINNDNNCNKSPLVNLKKHFKHYCISAGDNRISNINNHTCTNPMKKGCLIKRNECKQNATQERSGGEYEENSLIIKSLNQSHDFEYNNQYHEGYHHRDDLNNSGKQDVRTEQQCNTGENLYTSSTTTPTTATTGWINNHHGDADRVLLHEENDIIRQKHPLNSMKSLIIENVIYPDEDKSYRCANFLSKSNGLESSLLYDHLLPITNDEIKSSETGHPHNNYELPSLCYTNLSNDITGLNISSLYNYAEQIWSPSLFSSITSSFTSTTGLGLGTNHPPTFHAFNQHLTPNLSCTGCYESIQDKLFLSMDNKYWHLNCLRCFKCGITLQWEKTCFVKNDSVFCREHYKMLSSCFRCGEKLQKNDLIFQVDADTLYHESCFNCYICGRLLKCGDTYIMDGKTIQCSLHDNVTANKQSYIMTKILASSLSDLFTAANYAHSYSSNSQAQTTSSTNIKLPEMFNSKGLDEMNTGNGNVNLERTTTEMKPNLISGMMKLPDEYEHQKCVPMSFGDDAIDFNSTCITEAPQGNYPIVQLCDTYDKHLMKTKLGQIPSEVNESPAEFPLIADKFLPCDEKELNETKNSQFYFTNTNINYITDNLISNSQTPSAFTEVIGKTIKDDDDDNNSNNKNNFNVETMLNFLPRIDTVNNSFGVKSNVTSDNMTITGSSSSNNNKNCLLNISSTWTSNCTTLTSPVHSFCSSSSSSPSLSSTCLVSSSSPPLGISGSYSKLILTSKNNTPTSIDNGSSFNSRVSKQVEQGHILNKIEMPILTHFFENHDNKYNGKFISVDKQQSFNDNIKSQVLIDISIKNSNLLKSKLSMNEYDILTEIQDGKLEQFKSGKAQKSTKRLDNERLLSTDKLHGRLEKTTGKMKRIRTSFKHQQLRIMKSYFEFSHNPDSKDLKQLSQKTGLSKRVLQVWFQNARAKFRRNTNSQVYVENSKSNDSIPVVQYTTSTTTTTTPPPPPLNMNLTNESTCQNITDPKFYTGLGAYNYEEEKADSIYPKPVTSDYDIFLSTSSNHQNNTRLANNFSSHDDNKHDIICLTSDLPNYGDNLSQPVR